MNHTDKFYAYLKELDESYTSLADLLRQKLAAVTRNDLVRLDEIIKDEQAYILKARGFDQNLQTHRDRLGLKGDNLAQVIEELPQEHRDSFRRLHKRLKTTLDEVQALNKKCQGEIEDRLYVLDRSIKELDKAENATYRQSGESNNAPGPGAGMFSKSV